MSTPDDNWELTVRSRKSPKYAMGVAALLVIVHVGLALSLGHGSTGVYFRAADQIAMAAIGCVLAGGVLLLTRPRVRVGKRGIAVRNVLGEKVIDWDLFEGLSFPDGAAWARIELPDDEYMPVMAIQSNDREHAVDAVVTFRDIADRYAPATHRTN